MPDLTDLHAWPVERLGMVTKTADLVGAPVTTDGQKTRGWAPSCVGHARAFQSSPLELGRNSRDVQAL